MSMKILKGTGLGEDRTGQGEDRLNWGMGGGGGGGGWVGLWSNEEGKQPYKKHLLKLTSHTKSHSN